MLGFDDLVRYGLARGHHREDGLVDIDPHLDEGGSPPREGGVEGGPEAILVLGPPGLDAEGGGELLEVRSAVEGRLGVAAMVEHGLPLAHHAEGAVVHQ